MKANVLGFILGAGFVSGVQGADVYQSEATAFVGTASATRLGSNEAKKVALKDARDEALKFCNERMKACFIINETSNVDGITKVRIDEGMAGEFQGLGGRSGPKYQTNFNVSARVIVIGTN